MIEVIAVEDRNCRDKMTESTSLITSITSDVYSSFVTLSVCASRYMIHSRCVIYLQLDVDKVMVLTAYTMISLNTVTTYQAGGRTIFSRMFLKAFNSTTHRKVYVIKCRIYYIIFSLFHHQKCVVIDYSLNKKYKLPVNT